MFLRTIGFLMMAGAAACAVCLSAASAREGAAADEGRITLVFSIDQGFGNGLVVHDDQVALTRIIAALRPLQQRFRVLVILNPMVRDKPRLHRVLDTLSARGMPFVLDVYTSDALTLGSCSEQNAPHDPSHGLTVSPDQLAALKQRLGKWLAGIRFTEVFAEDFTVRAVRTTNPEWALPCWKLPEDDFFQPSLAERYLKLASETGLFVQFSDWHWKAFAGWDSHQQERERQLTRLLKQYPGMVTVTFANNEPSETSVPRLQDWETAVRSFVKDGAAGFGLSCQSWLRRDETACPPEEFASWALSALNKGPATSVDRHGPVPSPRAARSKAAYRKPGWASRGRPRDRSGWEPRHDGQTMPHPSIRYAF